MASRNKKSILHKIPRRGQALTRADRLIGAVTRVGFQWPDLKGPLQKVAEEFEELKAEIRRKPRDPKKLEAELGDFLFTVCNIAFLLGVPPERAFHKMLDRFERRFRHVEFCVKKSGKSWKQSTFAELDRYWDEAKRREKALARRRS